ncbi:MAG: ankyrin repeat domain-containing protein [Candidatus Cardinium sp.]
MVLSLVSCGNLCGIYFVNEDETYIPETLNGISRDPTLLTNNLKMTDLHMAVAYGDINRAESLIKDPKTDVNATDSDGKTGLYLACEKNDLAMVSILLTHNDINVNKKNCYGNGPIHLASRLGCYAIVEKLISCISLEINAKNFHGKTALTIAFDNNRIGIVHLLLKDISTKREESCSICLESFDDIFPDNISIETISLIHITTFGHFFHKSCIKQCIDIEQSSEKTCSICRQAIKPVN